MVGVRISAASVDAAATRLTLQAMRKAATRTKQRMRYNVITSDLIRTGTLLNSFQYRTVSKAPPTIRIYSTDPAAKYPEFGRRGFSAPPGKVLAFVPKGGTGVVFAKRVGPVRAYRFMWRAKNQLKLRDFV